MNSSPTGWQTAILLLLAVGVVLALHESPPTPPILALGALHGVVAVWAAHRLPLVLCVDLIIVAWHTSAFAPFMFGTQFDTWMHLGIVRRVTEHGPFPPDPFFEGFAAAPLVSIVHHIYAVATLLSGVPADRLWLWGAPAGVAALGASAYWMHRELLADRRAAVFAALFYVVWIRSSWWHATYPRALAPIFLFAGLFWLWRSLRGRRSLAALVSGVCLGLTIAAHPVAGATSALVVAGVLAVEWAVRVHGGTGHAFARTPLLVVGGAVLAASPVLVADTLAWLSRLDVVPVIWSDTDTVSHYVATRLRAVTRLGWYEKPGYTGWIWLWTAPVSIGAIGLCIGRATDRLVGVYVFGSAAVVLTALYSPIAPLMEHVLAPRYLARFTELLPLPTLAGFGLSLAAIERGPVAARIAAALLIGLTMAGLLRGVEPWSPNEIEPTVSVPGRAALERLEPQLHERVVLADASTAYRLPYLTGAYTAWNVQEHSNPWLYDAQRRIGARAILAGRWSPERAIAWCDRYGVEFILLRANAPDAARRRLLESGAFRLRDTADPYLLLERVERGARRPVD